MAEFDHGVKFLAQTTGRQLARLAGVECQEWTAIESTVQVTAERLADRVFRARRGRHRFVVYLEFFTSWDRSAPWDMLLKSAMLSNRERLPTVTLVFILRPRGYRPQQGQFRLAVGNEPTQQFWFHEVPLWLQVPESWWEQEPGLMMLYPLCRHGRRSREAVRHAARIIEERVAERVQLADSLFILNIFGGLAYPNLDVRAIIGREKMKESRFYRDILAEGREEGREIGLLEGEVKAKRADLLDLLKIRFSESFATEVSPTINAITDSAEFTPLFHLAIRCSRIAKFRAALPKS